VIYPELRAIERQRQRMIFLIVLLALIGIGVIWLIFRAHIPAISLFFWIPIYFFVKYLQSKIVAFTKQFKPRVVNLVLKHLNPQLLYEAEAGIPEEEFMKSGIFVTGPSSYHAEDYVSGRIGTAEFELCEVHARQSPRVEGGPTTLFRGLFFRTKMPEASDGIVLILPKEDSQYLIRSIKAITRARGQRVEISDERFNSNFVAYSTSDSAVVNLLTDNMLTDIVNYRETYHKKMYISFCNGYFHLAVRNDTDILEPNVWKSNVSFALVKAFYDDLVLITSVVQDFDLKN
jgi:Protein of unknown function (DUF3137)